MSQETHGATAVEFWEIPAAPSDTERQTDALLLSPSERARAGRYRFTRDRDLFVTCRAALRRILGRRMNVPPDEVRLETDPLGKPFVSDVDFHFNVSHSSGKGVVVVSQQPVGVDIEAIHRIVDAAGVAQRFFTPREQDAVFRTEAADEVNRRFLVCWTLKEALLKARGVGLTAVLTDFSVDIDRSPHQVRWEAADVPDTDVWSLATLQVSGDYVGAAAVKGTSVRLCPRYDAVR